MPIRFVCPFGHPLVVPDDRAGKRGRCPVCNQRVVIPRPDEGAGAPLAGEGSLDVPIEIDHQRRAPAGFGAEGRGAVSGRSAQQATTGSVEEDLPEPVAPAALVERPTSDFAFATDEAPRPSGPAPSRAPRRRGPAAPPYESPPQFRLRAWSVAIAASGAALLTLAPAVSNLATAAGWMWLTLAVGATLLAYSAWLAWLPDWSTLWVGSWLFALAAALHAAASTFCLAIDRASWPLGLAALPSPGRWAGLIALICASIAALCLLVARPWRDDYEDFRAGRPRAAIDGAGPTERDTTAG